MTELEKLLTNSIMATEGLIFLELMFARIVKKVGPKEFAKITDPSGEMITVEMRIPKKLDDFLKEVQEEVLEIYMASRLLSLPEEKKEEARESFRELIEVWMIGARGKDYTTGLYFSICEMAKKDPERIIEEIENFMKDNEPHFATLKELKG